MFLLIFCYKSVLALEKANKGVQMIQGEQRLGTPVHTLNTHKNGKQLSSFKSPQKTPGSWDTDAKSS